MRIGLIDEDCHADKRRWGATQYPNLALCKIAAYHKALGDTVDELQPFVTPELGRGASYGWDGGTCPNDNQRKFLTETYYLYREIYHQVTLEDAKHVDMSWSVYLGETLTCDKSG